MKLNSKKYFFELNRFDENMRNMENMNKNEFNKFCKQVYYVGEYIAYRTKHPRWHSVNPKYKKHPIAKFFYLRPHWFYQLVLKCAEEGCNKIRIRQRDLGRAHLNKIMGVAKMASEYFLMYGNITAFKKVNEAFRQGICLKGADLK